MECCSTAGAWRWVRSSSSVNWHATECFLALTSTRRWVRLSNDCARSVGLHLGSHVLLRMAWIVQQDDVSRPERHEAHFEFQEKDAIVDDRIPSEIVTFQFHTAFLTRSLTKVAEAVLAFTQGSSLHSKCRTHLPHTPPARFGSFCTFPSAWPSFAIAYEWISLAELTQGFNSQAAIATTQQYVPPRSAVTVRFLQAHHELLSAIGRTPEQLSCQRVVRRSANSSLSQIEYSTHRLEGESSLIACGSLH